MIRIFLFKEKLTQTDYKVTEYINENLKSMVEVYIDYLRENDGFELIEKLEPIFPRDYLKRKPQECENIVEELYEIIIKHNIRDYIKPKYEYALYHIIHWWIDIQDNEEDYIPRKVDVKLREEIENNEDYWDEENNVILMAIGNVKNYLDFCFEDQDFLPEFLDNAVSLYLTSPEVVNIMFQYEDLDDYIDLMSVDIRELYLEKRGEMKRNIEKEPQYTEEKIIKELYNIITQINNQATEMQNKDEVELSNEIFRMSKRLFKCMFDLEVERESTIGCSMKKLGENDIYIYMNNDKFINVAIGENKVIEKFSDAIGQVLGYLNPTFNFGFTISINRKKLIRDAYTFIYDKLGKERYKDFPVKELVKEPFGEEYRYIIKSVHDIPEDSTRTMNLYHLILDLNIEYRRKVAIESRSR
ncbi:hypothetical protein [Clostridium sp. UBA1056]|uniref:hypothetical protein n=1 Tax=unclassified Clostridium TaxID=2614128 RepID=UPI0032177F79